MKYFKKIIKTSRIKDFKKTEKESGFTLVEMLVAIFIFSLVIGAVISLFISGIQGQRNTLAIQRLLDQTSYTLEYMSRALRMALKEGQQATPLIDCLDEDGENYEIGGNNNSRLKFINHLENDDCQEFLLDVDNNGNGRLKQKKAGGDIFLTSDELDIEFLEFRILGESQDDDNQPKVTLSLRIKGTGASPGGVPEVNIQTTISQRNLDILQ